MPPRYINPKSRKYKIKELIMDEGSICIMDTGVWHKWGIIYQFKMVYFSIYTGWFVKPYYDYSSITNKKINKVYKKLLHKYSTPPKINEGRDHTVVKY